MTLVGAKTFIWPPMGQVRDSVHSLGKGDARVPNAIRLLRRAKPLCAKATPIFGARHRFETLAQHQRRQHSTGNALSFFVMITIQSPDRGNTMTATIVITTKNRKEDLIRALDSCMRQRGIVETLVVDDGSTDGTSALVRSCFPSVRLVRFEESRGYIRARNEAARLAEGDVIISIDDDAEFSQPSIVETVLSEMEDPRVAAVAMPFIDVNLEKKLKQCAPDRNGTWITNEFIGTAHAIRKVVFREVGGYREVLFHQCEEGDFCIRLLERGWVVRLGNSAPILHYHSPLRSQERMNVFGQRNLMLFAWHNVPMPEFIAHLITTTLNGLLWGLRRGQFFHRLRGSWCGLLASAQELSCRRPVTRRTYWFYRRLKKYGSIPLQDAARIAMQRAA